MFRNESVSNPSEGCIPHLKQVRRLTLSLIASVSVNIVLVAVILYAIGGGFILSRCEMAGRLWNSNQAIADGRTAGEVLNAFAHMLPEQLVAKMSSSHRIEEGLTERDLALGCLVSLHHFDLAKALHGTSLPKGQSLSNITVYPGLNDRQFGQIASFINSERWPLTSEGLFLALKRLPQPQDPSLTEAFYLTPEFLTLQRLFARSEACIERSEILDLLMEGEWRTVNEFYQAALQVNESSPALRRRLLLAYVEGGSKKATYLVLKSDGAYSSTYFDDGTVLAMMHLIDKVTPEVETFVAELVHSPRSDQVLQKAHKLCSSALVAAVKEIEEKRPAALPCKEKIYVVQRGDSLWKISRQVKVSIQTLKDHNKLDSDMLKPGATLRIP